MPPKPNAYPTSPFQVLGNEHPSVAESMNNLALLMCDKMDGKSALEYAEKCLTIAGQYYTPDHPEYLNYHGNFGIVLKVSKCDDDDKKLVWPTWAVGVLSLGCGKLELESTERRKKKREGKEREGKEKKG
jgi:hypothetical protein